MFIVKDAIPYRVRRGRLVVIPAAWRGTMPTPKTIRGRPSKALHKHRKAIKYCRETQKYRDRHVPAMPVINTTNPRTLMEILACS